MIGYPIAILIDLIEPITESFIEIVLSLTESVAHRSRMVLYGLPFGFVDLPTTLPS